MDLGFLKNFGQMIGHGAKAGFGAVKSGIGKLGEMGDDDDEDGGGTDNGNGGLRGLIMNASRPKPMPMTPGFNQDASMPSLKAPVMPGSDAGLINRRQSMPSQMPQLMPPNAPKFEPIRDSIDIHGQSPMGQVSVTDHQPQMIPSRFTANAPPNPQPMAAQSFGQESVPMVARFAPREDRREDVPIPQLPGHRGDPIPYNEMDAAKWDHVYGKMRHTDDGRHELGVKRSWKDALANSVLAMNKSFQEAGGYHNPNAWQAGLVGGAAGGIGTAIAPQAGREVNFDWAHRPEIEDRMRRQDESSDRDLKMRRGNAEIEGIRARNKATIAGMKDANIERRKAESAIALNEARRQAAITGQAKTVEVVGDDGQVHVVRVNNDGSVDLGESGRAAMNTQRIQSREGIADKQIGSREKIAGNAQKGAMDRVRAQQGGANYRAGLSQSGQNQRTDKRIQAQYGAGGEYIPPVGSVPGGGGSARERFIQKAIEAGHSREAAEAEATRRKY